MLPLVLSGSTANFWNLLVGWFLLQNAGQSAQYATVQDKLSGLTAEDAVVPNSPIVSADISLRKFANDYVIGKTDWNRFLVVNEEGQLLGAIAIEDLKTISVELWPQIKVKELMQPIDESKTVKSDRSLLEVATLLEEQRLTQLPVIRDNGVLIGLLEKTSIIKLLQGQAQLA